MLATVKIRTVVSSRMRPAHCTKEGRSLVGSSAASAFTRRLRSSVSSTTSRTRRATLASLPSSPRVSAKLWKSKFSSNRTITRHADGRYSRYYNFVAYRNASKEASLKQIIGGASADKITVHAS